MPVLKIKNLQNKEVGEIELSDVVFGGEVNHTLLHEVVRMQRNRKRSRRVWPHRQKRSRRRPLWRSSSRMLSRLRMPRPMR